MPLRTMPINFILVHRGHGRSAKRSWNHGLKATLRLFRMLPAYKEAEAQLSWSQKHILRTIEDWWPNFPVDRSQNARSRDRN